MESKSTANKIPVPALVVSVVVGLVAVATAPLELRVQGAVAVVQWPWLWLFNIVGGGVLYRLTPEVGDDHVGLVLFGVALRSLVVYVISTVVILCLA